MNIEYVENVINYSTPAFVRGLSVRVGELLARAKGEMGKIIDFFRAACTDFLADFCLCSSAAFCFANGQVFTYWGIHLFIVIREIESGEYFPRTWYPLLSLSMVDLLPDSSVAERRSSAAEPDIACTLPIKSNAISSRDTPFAHSFCLRSPLSLSLTETLFRVRIHEHCAWYSPSSTNGNETRYIV